MSPLQKCPTCDGLPWVMRIRETTEVPCGFIKEAIRCPECNGTGVAKKPVGRVRAFLARVGVRA